MLGKQRYTLTECLLANLSNCDFSLAPKNGLETEKVFEVHIKFNNFAAWLFSPVSRPVTPRDALSRVQDRHGAQVNITNERLLWDIREVFDTKDGGAANFKKIIRV